MKAIINIALASILIAMVSSHALAKDGNSGAENHQKFISEIKAKMKKTQDKQEKNSVEREESSGSELALKKSSN